MINIISYLMPWLGLTVCLYVVLTKRVDTTCPIRVTKMCLWLLVWTLIAYYDYPYDANKPMTVTTARAMLIVINLLYIAESILYRQKHRVNNTPN